MRRTSNENVECDVDWAHWTYISSGINTLICVQQKKHQRTARNAEVACYADNLVSICSCDASAGRLVMAGRVNLFVCLFQLIARGEASSGSHGSVFVFVRVFVRLSVCLYMSLCGCCLCVCVCLFVCLFVCSFVSLCVNSYVN